MRDPCRVMLDKAWKLTYSQMTAGESGEDQKSHIDKDKYAKVPARRPGKDEDMAGAILFAATNQYLNGQTIAVDGGYILHAGA